MKSECLSSQLRILTNDEILKFRQAVTDNYRCCGRKFPWRETSDPYAIVVSEMMLQQTQTIRVLPKYNAWLQRFPSAEMLATASLDDVLSLWNGLGYNRRARYLQETCRIVCSEYGGKFPDRAEELEKLPGIGPYTAGAVLSFAFGKPAVYIETNIRSVFIFFFYTDYKEKVSDKLILPLVKQTLLQENPREWYYSLMDYGAELKRKVKNPSRKSVHYTKQSRFEGSLRQARGAVLRNLVGCRRTTLEQIAKMEDIPFYRIKEAADCLVAEKLIEEQGDEFRICD